MMAEAAAPINAMDMVFGTVRSKSRKENKWKSLLALSIQRLDEDNFNHELKTFIMEVVEMEETDPQIQEMVREDHNLRILYSDTVARWLGSCSTADYESFRGMIGQLRPKK